MNTVDNFVISQEKLNEGFTGIGFGFFGCKMSLEMANNIPTATHTYWLKLWAPDMWYPSKIKDGYVINHELEWVSPLAGDEPVKAIEPIVAIYKGAPLGQFCVSREMTYELIQDQAKDPIFLLQLFREMAHDLVRSYVDENISYQGMKPFANLSVIE